MLFIQIYTTGEFMIVVTNLEKHEKRKYTTESSRGVETMWKVRNIKIKSFRGMRLFEIHQFSILRKWALIKA